MPTTSPSGRYRQVVPVPSWWSSMGRPAEADLVVELAGREHVVGGEPDVAVDPARLRPRSGCRGDQPRPLVARHLVDQEAGVLEGLAAPGHLGLGEQPRVGRADHPAALAAGRGVSVMIVAVIPSTGVMWSEPPRRAQVAAAGGRLLHQPVQLLGDAAAALGVHADQAEAGRDRPAPAPARRPARSPARRSGRRRRRRWRRPPRPRPPGPGRPWSRPPAGGPARPRPRRPARTRAAAPTRPRR